MGNIIASCLFCLIPKQVDYPNLINIDNGVIIEIMSRLPIKSLARCQLVCKDWQSMIHSHYFRERHMAHTNVVNPYHNIQIHNNPNPVKLRYSFIYKHGCNGLLLMLNLKDGKPYVWNPAIRRVLKLPRPHDGSLGFAFSFVPATKSYRIVSFFYNRSESGGGNIIGCEVFAPGHDKSWRRLLLEITKSSNGKKERVSVVSAGGAVHCVIVTRVGQLETTNVEVVSLDLETEEFTVNCFPVLDVVGWKNYWDVDWDGKLAIVDVVGQNVEVVELEDYKNGRWSVKKEMNIGLEGNEEVFPLLVRDGDVWFWLKDEKIFTYTIETGERTEVSKVKRYSMGSKLYPFKPSLISFKGMLPDKELDEYRLSFFSS